MPTPSESPVSELPITHRQARRLTLAAFVLGALAIVANSLTALAFFPVWAMQLCGVLAGMFTALSIYCAKMAPGPTTPTRRDEK